MYVHGRYNDAGRAVDVMLLDLQLVQYSPPTTDLSYFLYTATTGDLRKPNLQVFLECYYGTLTSIMKAAGQEAPFEQTQFIKDFRKKSLYGGLFGIMSAPIAIMNSADEMVSSQDTGDGIDNVFSKARANVMDTLKSNPMLGPRLLSLVDEMIDLGFIA